MQLTDIPSFMHALLVDLKSDAWRKRVRLVLDTSRPIQAHLPADMLAKALACVLAELLAQASPNDSISVVTSFESRESIEGSLCIEVTAPSAFAIDPKLDALLTSMSSYAKHVGVSRTGVALTVSLHFANAFICQTRPSLNTALIIDDDAAGQALLASYLATRGFQTIGVNDGFDALIVLERQDLELVVVDLCMPTLESFELVRRIKMVRPALPIIAICSHPKTMARLADVDAAYTPDVLLAKPYSANDLDQTLQHLGLPMLEVMSPSSWITH